MKKVGIVDLETSNSRGVEAALSSIDQNCIVSTEVEQLKKCSALIIPGVGNFGSASKFLHNSGLAEFLRERHILQTPILGICLGLQLLFEASEESPGYGGLGLLPGKSTKLPESGLLKVPNIGWKEMGVVGERLRKSFVPKSLLYFAHSYEVKTSLGPQNIAEINYGGRSMLAALRVDNVWGSQFHPEKSHHAGLFFLESFIVGDN